MNFNKLRRVNVLQLPDEVFMDGTKVVEIMRARILTRQEKKSRERGAPDIQLRGLAGAQTYITRTDLVKMFIGMDGRKITIASWKSGKNYLVYTQKNTRVAILHSPRKPRYLLELPNKKVLKPGYYFVCDVNETGKIDKLHGIQVGPSVFKKMFVINESTDEYIAKIKTATKDSAIVVEQTANRVKQAENARNSRSNNIGVSGGSRGVVTPSSVLNTKQVQDSTPKINAKAKMHVVAKILNRENQLVGYVISNGKEEKPFQKNKVIEMCRKHALRNMSLVEKDGKEYLRGVGITHDSLPTKYI